MGISHDGDFEPIALWEALDARRREAGLTWTQVMAGINSAAPGVVARLGEHNHPMAQSTVSSMRKRGSVPCQHALAMLHWLGRTPESFMPDATLDTPDAALTDVGPDRRLRWNIPALAAAVSVASAGSPGSRSLRRWGAA